MKDKKYYLTEKQLAIIYHYGCMFRQNADGLKEICSVEKPYIEYGFDLGKIHSHLMDCNDAMRELHNSIENQKIKK